MSSIELSRLGPLCLVASVLALAAPAAWSAEPSQCAVGQVPAGKACKSVPEAADDLAAIIEARFAKEGLKAAIARVSIDGMPILTRAWGESMTGVPASDDMHFRNGAIAMTYLGTLLLQLQDRGLLHTSDTLSKWFPEYPKAAEITLAMLVRSTSGYADYVNLDILPIYADVFRDWQAKELIDIGLGQPMKCDPGTCFAYAHTNFVILGEVFSKATGKPLAELLREYILDPLDLRNTVSDQTAVIPQPVLHAFDGERGVYEDSTYWNPSWTVANGAVMTTDIRDALTSIEAVGSGRLLSEAAFAEQTAPVTATLPPFSQTAYYGMGVVLSNGWFVQNPSFSGYAVTVAYDPKTRIGIAMSVTAGPKTGDGNFALEIVNELGSYFLPDRGPGRR